MDFEESGREVEPRFNSAIDLLERISLILRRISFLHVLYPNDNISRQKEHIHLTRSFYTIATPIIPISMIKKYHQEILNLQVENQTAVRSGMQRVVEVFSPKLEKRLWEILMELQLSIKTYFMPQGEGDDYEL